MRVYLLFRSHGVSAGNSYGSFAWIAAFFLLLLSFPASAASLVQVLPFEIPPGPKEYDGTPAFREAFERFSRKISGFRFVLPPVPEEEPVIIIELLVEAPYTLSLEISPIAVAFPGVWSWGVKWDAIEVMGCLTLVRLRDGRTWEVPVEASQQEPVPRAWPFSRRNRVGKVALDDLMKTLAARMCWELRVIGRSKEP